MTRRSDPRTTRLPVPAGQIPTFTPVPRQCERHDGWTPERQIAFIEALADTGSVGAACKVVDMSTVGAYYLRRQPGAESFRAAWAAALALGVERLEDVAMDRALNGVDEPVYSYGELVGVRKKVNDRLLMFMLRNRSPERFGASVNGGSLKGLNAVGKMEKKRLKAKWRKQWEKEQRQVSHADVCASIDRKIEAIRIEVAHRRQREWEQMSEETRAAWDHFVKLRDADFERLDASEDMRFRHERGPSDTFGTTPPPNKELPAPDVEPEWRTLKGDGE